MKKITLLATIVAISSNCFAQDTGLPAMSQCIFKPQELHHSKHTQYVDSDHIVTVINNSNLTRTVVVEYSMRYYNSTTGYFDNFSEKRKEITLTPGQTFNEQFHLKTPVVVEHNRIYPLQNGTTVYDVYARKYITSCTQNASLKVV